MATNLRFIKEESGNDISTLSIEDCFEGYDTYKIRIEIGPCASGGNLFARLLDNNNSAITTSTYDYSFEEYDDNGSTQVRQGTFSTVGQTSIANNFLGQTSTDSTDSNDTWITIYNPNIATHTFLTAHAMRYYTKFRNTVGGAIEKSDTLCKGFQIYTASGTWDSGRLQVYGVGK